MDLDTDKPLDTVKGKSSRRQRIPALLSRASKVRPLQAENLLPLDFFISVPMQLNFRPQILSANHIAALRVADQGSRQT